MNLMKHFSSKIIDCLENKEIPWKRPWQGAVGVPRNFFTKKKYDGANIIFLNISTCRNKFVSPWWGTIEQFDGSLKGKPTEILCKNQLTLVYNADQLLKPPNTVFAQQPDYTLADKVLHAVPARIKNNEVGEAAYFFPPSDYITIPVIEAFKSGIGGVEGYYETLSHELGHWTEPRLGFDYNGYQKPDEIRELRAEIVAGFMMMELKIPHSIAYRNFSKYRQLWINKIKNDPSIIFNIAESAVDAVDCILAHSRLKEKR